MLAGNKTFRGRPVATVSAAALPWHTEGLLVAVEGGQGTPRWVTDQVEPENMVRHESQYLTLEKIAVEYLASG